MRFIVSSPEHVALNAIELRAVEMSERGESWRVAILLDEQLERDPSRAAIACSIATGANLIGYADIFRRMQILHDQGESDAYAKSHTSKQISKQREMKAKLFSPTKPPKYEDAILEPRTTGSWLVNKKRQ